MTPSGQPGAFERTRWTLVLRARDGTVESRAALSELCEAYYQPVFHFLRRSGRHDDTARELTQEFFRRRELFDRHALRFDQRNHRFAGARIIIDDKNCLLDIHHAALTQPS